MAEDIESLTNKVEALTALVAGLVAKSGLTESDVKAYIARRHPMPTGDSGDKMRELEAKKAFHILR